MKRLKWQGKPAGQTAGRSAKQKTFAPGLSSTHLGLQRGRQAKLQYHRIGLLHVRERRLQQVAAAELQGAALAVAAIWGELRQPREFAWCLRDDGEALGQRGREPQQGSLADAVPGGGEFDADDALQMRKLCERLQSHLAGPHA